MHVNRTIAVVAQSVFRGSRCRYCRQPITWATVPSSARGPAKTLPFDGRPFPLREDYDEATGVHYEWWPRAALHFKSCTNMPPRRTHPKDRHV